MKKRKTIIISLLLIISSSGFSQSCMIEFYLLKKDIRDFDSTREMAKGFDVKIDDLCDSPFITNSEVLSFYVRKDKMKKSKVRETHIFTVPDSVTRRINDLQIPLCCGKQFALVVDNVIVYTGYFWNRISSFGCHWINAYAYEKEILIYKRLPDYGDSKDTPDPRKSPVLFNCLLTTGRMKHDNQ